MGTSSRLRSLLAAVLGVVGLVAAGCGISPTAAKDPTAPLEVWSRSNPASAKVYEEIFAAFERATGIDVDYKAVPIDFDKWIQRRASAKNLPDVLINDTGMLGLYHSQGLVTEIQPDAITGGADITDRAWDNAKANDGHYYGVPFSAQAMVTLIRKDWREKLGRPVPTTWAELAELATAFTTQDPDGDGQANTYGMLVPGTTDRGYLAWWAASYLYQGGGDILAPTGDGGYRVAVDSPESVAAVQWLRGLFCDSKVIQPGALTTSTADAHPFFETGKAGIYLTGPYNFGRFDKSLGKDRYEVVPTPAGPAGRTVLGEGENVYLMAGSARPDAQRALAEFLISPQAQQIGMRGKPQPVVRLPVNRTVDVHATYQDPRWDMVAEIYAEDAKPFPSVPNFQPFRQQTSEALNTILASCSTDVPGELGALAAALTKELQSQGMKTP